MNCTEILPLLKGVKRSGAGWMAICPAHEDRKASLSINKGDDGRILMHCHAGCSNDAIVDKMGLSLRDLMPTSGNGNPADNGKSIIVATYDYRDEQGKLLYQICRMQPKTFRQRKPRQDGGWEWSTKGVRKLPYHLPELQVADPRDIVYITEGEKDVENLVKLGFVATCNSGGAGKWRPEFNEYLRGRRVVVLPDKDTPGRKHAQQIASNLQGIAAEIKVVELPGTGKDVSDWLDACGTAEELQRIVEATTTTRPPAKMAHASPQWRPFPITVLPEPIRTFVRQASVTIGVDPSYVVTALLPALAAAIGNSRLIMLKRGWVEPAVLWGVLVGDSGTMKSPSIDVATRYVQQRQAKAIAVHQRAMEQYDRDLEQRKGGSDRWKLSGKRNGEPLPEEIVKPKCERFSCSDVTVEGLSVLLEDAPRGLLLIRDELAGWIGGFDQYKGGKGSDTAHWLTIHGARDLIVDRKGTDRPTVFARRAAVSIVGGIQPGTLRRVLGQKHFENGLAARLLMAMPSRQSKQWTESEISDALDQEIGRLFDRLYLIEPRQNANDQPEPAVMVLSSSGKAAWVEFYNQHAEWQANATEEQAAVLSKLEGAAARLALILHCVRQAAGDRTVSDQVDDQDIAAGVAIARWYANEADRVYHVLKETDNDRLRRQAIELISRRGGRITANDLRRRSRHFETSDDAERFLDEFAEAGVGTWEPIGTTKDGGRPSREFVLSDSVSVSVSVSVTQEILEDRRVSDTGSGEEEEGEWSESDWSNESADKTPVSLTHSTPEGNWVWDTETTSKK